MSWRGIIGHGRALEIPGTCHRSGTSTVEDGDRLTGVISTKRAPRPHGRANGPTNRHALFFFKSVRRI